MSKVDYIFLIALSVLTASVVACSISAILGLLIPNENTLWFLFLGSGFFILAGMLTFIKYKWQ